MQVTPKSTASSSAVPAPSGSAKSTPVSFLDLLFGASADSASGAGVSDSKPGGRPAGNSASHDSNEPNKRTADATETALLSNVAQALSLPIQVNIQAAGQSSRPANPDGVSKTVESTAAAVGSVAANRTTVLVSTTQIGPSLLSDSATVPLAPLPTIPAEAGSSSTPTGGQIPADPGSGPLSRDPKPQVPAEQQPPAAQANPNATQPGHAANAGMAKAMLVPLPLNHSQITTEATSPTPKPNPTDALPAPQTAAQPVAAPASRLSLNLAAAVNLNTLPLSFAKGTASGNTETGGGITDSSRGWNSQSNAGANATNSDSKSAAAPAKTDQTNQTTISSGPSHGGENNGQQNQNLPADASQGAIAAKTADAASSRLIPAPPVSRPGDAQASGPAPQVSDSSTHRGADSGSLISEPSSALASAGAPGINAARVIQSMSGTEMRVGMHSSDFGEISIHTSLSQLQLQTQISVNHNELGSAIATHIPAIQAKLGSEHGIHASIEVSQTGSSLSGNAGQSSSQRNQKAFIPTTASISDPAPADPDYSLLRPPPAAIEGSRLDIRA